MAEDSRSMASSSLLNLSDDELMLLCESTHVDEKTLSKLGNISSR